MNGKNRVLFRNKIVLFAILSLIFLQQCDSRTKDTKESRPKEWAVAIRGEGLPNLHKVSDRLYRGAQPEKQGFDELKKMGIKTIVNFRGSEKDLKHITGKGFNYYHIPVNTFFPKKEEFAYFLEIVSKPDNGPVFVHCKHGADRTGTAVALYRIKIQGWDVEKAIHEMVNGGYHFHRIHWQLKQFIRTF